MQEKLYKLGAAQTAKRQLRCMLEFHGCLLANSSSSQVGLQGFVSWLVEDRRAQLNHIVALPYLQSHHNANLFHA